jgi:hypothetical protein
MKHSSSRDLYGYWDRQRGTRTVPDRMDIDPSAIPRVLADTFLLGSETGGDMFFRLAGTRVCALFCREMKGEPFVPLFGRGSRDQMRELLGIVCDEGAATVAGVTARIGDGAAAELELLLLPLRHHGRFDTRILGVLAPINPPYWLGTMPATALSLGPLRHLEPMTKPAPLLPIRLPVRGGKVVRRGFVVYDGGRH